MLATLMSGHKRDQKLVSAQLLMSLANVVIRGLSIVSRFALSLYIAKYMGLSDVGVFGIVLGIVGLMPSMVGFGLNYFVSREIIDLPVVDAARKIRDRLCLTFLMCSISTLIFLILYETKLIIVPDFRFEILFIVVLEVFCLDIHMSLIALRMPLFASILLFIRSASWVFIFILVSEKFPALQTLKFAFDLWLTGLLANYIVLFVRFFRWPWLEISSASVDFAWLRLKIVSGWLIYMSDWALAGSVYIDRFIVTDLIGIRATGIYMFFWSVANSSQALITSSIIQVALPRMVAAYRAGDERRWRSIMLEEGIKVFFIGTVIAVAAFLAIKHLLPYIKRDELSGYMGLFAVMLSASIIRMLSDVLNYGLYSRGFDRAYASTNIAGIVISAALTVLLLGRFGLDGVGASMLITATILLLSRLAVLRNTFAITVKRLTI